MKHLNREVVIAKLFTPLARLGLGHGYRDDVDESSCEAPKKIDKDFSLAFPKKL
ncbi:MAG: hypothetical protein F6K48_01265 [Okeania sp. SIO3H1]|uniref:hypothetical protein n=1 Tax=Okeania sp. SIO1I7 TaxID=2607772 RepID=UPI0013CB38E8|nr:hypothetical protein [Okeania sp. SIO1I7]NEN87622.1 hypothetical protein [Okeania sp. SIO3H1]NET26386.1 hypothetical protein [Okeania sp. SIO1I7]